MNASSRDDRRAAVALLQVLTVLAAVASLVALCLVVSLFPVETPSLATLLPVDDADLKSLEVPSRQRFTVVRPEPLERRMFLVSVAALPFIVLGWHLAWKNAVERLSADAAHRLLSGVCALCVAAGAVYCFVLGGRGRQFIEILRDGPVWCAIVIAVAGGICGLLATNSRRSLAWVECVLWIVTAGTLGSVFLYSLYDIKTLKDDFIYDNHFNVIFHSMVQVCHGKELLVDFVHQYGLYPHFLAPLFRVIPLGVFSFSVLMGILAVASFALIAGALLTIATSRVIALIGLLAIVSGGYVTKVLANYDPYFQYVPLRTVFPTLVLFLVARYLKTRSRLLRASLYMLSAFAVLWNPETGVVVMVSVVLITLYDEYLQVGLGGAIRKVVEGLCVSAAAVAAFSGGMYLLYGEVPDFSELIRYARVFYGIGFYMLPMPRLHPWNLVAVLYIAGLAWGCAALVSGRASLRATYATYLSLVGIGLFSYYQGRSHDEVFALCTFPAYMLLTLFCDYLLQETHGLRLAKAAGLGGVAFLVIIAGGLYVGLRTMWDGHVGIVQRVADIRRESPTPVMERAAFVRERTQPGETVLILSGHSGVYHLAAGTVAPHRIPSILEIVLREDHERLIRYINQSDCSKLFVDTVGLPRDAIEYSQLRDTLSSRYVLQELSPDARLALYERVR